MLPVAVALAGGIVAGRYAPLGEAAWAIWGGSGLLLGVVAMVRGWRAVAAGGIAAAIFALGAVHVRLSYFRLPDDHIATYAGPARTLATIRGRVVSSPSVYRQEAELDYPRQPTTRFEVAAEEIHAADGWRSVSGLVQVAVAEEAPDVARGARVELAGLISRLKPPSNPGQRDLAADARRGGTLVECRVPVAAGVQTLQAASGTWARRLADRAGNEAQRHIRGCVPGRAELLVEALLLGRRDPALRPLQETMVRAGIAHLLSISGMHLGMFLGFVYLLCRLVMLSPRRSALAALLCLGGYLLLAEPRSPLVRSAVMAAALCVATIVGRRHMALNALAVAAVALLIADPMDLFAAGFQLSFVIVAGLIVLTPYVRDLLFGRWLRERGLIVFRGDQRVRRWLYFNAADWGMAAGAMSLLAWLLAAPLAAVHFGLFSPYGAVLTLLAAPLVVATIVPGYLSLALAWAAPNLSYALGRAAGAFADMLAWLVERAESLPGLHFELQPVGAAWAIVAYVAIVLGVLHRRLPWGRAWAAAAAVCLLGATVWTQLPAAPPAMAELNVLSVGAGQCAVLRTPSGSTWLLDAGSLGRESCGEQVLVPFLRHQRWPGPTAAFVSHANADHYNALPAVLRRGWGARVYLNEHFGHDPNAVGARPTALLLGEIARRGATVIRLHAGRTIRLDDRTTVQVLWPPRGRGGLSANDTSLVLRITCDDRTVLLPGDVESAGQAAVTALGRRVGADVLLLPHHGSWQPTLPDFYQAVSPEFALVSAGRKLSPPARGGDPAEKFYESLAAERKVYSTLQHGWLRVRFGKGRVDIETWR